MRAPGLSKVLQRRVESRRSRSREQAPWRWPVVIVIHRIGGADRDSEYDTTYTLPVLYSRLGIYGIAFERTSSVTDRPRRDYFAGSRGAGGSRRIQCSVECAVPPFRSVLRGSVLPGEPGVSSLWVRSTRVFTSCRV